jgi:hypothetical protein
VTKIRDYGGPTLLIYLDVGSDDGLKEADRVDIARDGRLIGTITIKAVRDAWAVGESYKTDAPIKVDDAVVLSALESE